MENRQYKIVFKAHDEELYSSFAKEHSDDNAGVDLYCKDDVEIQPGQMILLKLGISAKMMEMNDSVENKSFNYWLLPRSSISKKGLVMANSVGVIDKTYRGELMGAVVNLRGEAVKVARGERLFQIVAPDMGWIVKTVQVDELDVTGRGAGGFGSTGA
jgi:dUTP pyrophosphatase